MVTTSGNSGHVVVLNAWVGKRVIVKMIGK